MTVSVPEAVAAVTALATVVVVRLIRRYFPTRNLWAYLVVLVTALALAAVACWLSGPVDWRAVVLVAVGINEALKSAAGLKKGEGGG